MSNQQIKTAEEILKHSLATQGDGTVTTMNLKPILKPIYLAMESYAQQFKTDPPVKESLTTDWDELSEKFYKDKPWNELPERVFNWFKTNIGSEK
jgi:hypothetical protein